MDLTDIPTNQLLAWAAFGISIVAPLVVAKYIDKKRKRVKPLLGVVSPKKRQK